MFKQDNALEKRVEDERNTTEIKYRFNITFATDEMDGFGSPGASVSPINCDRT